MTTTDQPASNGSTATETEKIVPAQREHGLARLREDECYYLTNLIGDGLDEASHLVRKASSKAFSRTLDYDGSKGTAPLEPGRDPRHPQRSPRLRPGRHRVPVPGRRRPG